MQTKFILLITLTCFSQFLYAQKTSLKGTSIINKQDGQWSFQQYARNIVKVTFQPKGYKTNELVSDAVILKPNTIAPLISPYSLYKKIETTGVLISTNEDTIFLGNSKQSAVTFHSTNEYKGFRFTLKNNEKVFGAGERALPLNRRGYRFNLYNNPWYGYGMGADNLNYSVPFITSSNNYAVFFDNTSKGYLDIGKTNTNVLEYGAISGELNFYIIIGNSYPEILSYYHKLTGTQPLPPRWAMGNFLSRFGYTSEDEVKGIMQKMKQYNIPYDAVIFDLFWFGDSIKGTMGNLDWVNKKAWPQPRKMIDDFTKEGTKTILITEPFVLKSSLNYDNSKRFHAVDSMGNPYVLTDFYFGNGGLIDIFRNDSKDWFWSKYKMQMNKGVEGWWGDLGEPEKHPSNLYHNLKDLGFKRLFKADEVHNAYGHYWTKMLYDKYAKEYPAKRLFSLNRSGFAGTQRYGIFPWTGDVSRSWNGLQAQLPILLGMSMSGVPYVHSDAGGFAGSEKDAELYVRWLQFAQFTPIFRPHGTELSKVDTAAPSYPSEPALFDEPYRTLAKAVVDNRYKLLPYNYTLSYQQATSGKPLISPLYFYFRNDTTATKVEDEYMWGENILVAPVITKGATTRQVYLPRGTWFRYGDLSEVKGGKWINEKVELSTTPAYIKEGSFIPQYKNAAANTASLNKSELNLIYTPSANPSTFVMYDDDGESKDALTKKKYELITFASKGVYRNKVELSITPNNGSYLGKPAQREFMLTIPAVNEPVAIKVDGQKIEMIKSTPSGGALWLKDYKTLVFPVILKQKPVKVEIQW